MSGRRSHLRSIPIFGSPGRPWSRFSASLCVLRGGPRKFEPLHPLLKAIRPLVRNPAQRIPVWDPYHAVADFGGFLFLGVWDGVGGERGGSGRFLSHCFQLMARTIRTELWESHPILNVA